MSNALIFAVGDAAAPPRDFGAYVTEQCARGLRILVELLGRVVDQRRGRFEISRLVARHVCLGDPSRRHRSADAIAIREECIARRGRARERTLGRTFEHGDARLHDVERGLLCRIVAGRADRGACFTREASELAIVVNVFGGIARDLVAIDARLRLDSRIARGLRLHRRSRHQVVHERPLPEVARGDAGGVQHARDERRPVDRARVGFDLRDIGA